MSNVFIFKSYVYLFFNIQKSYYDFDSSILLNFFICLFVI